VQSRSSPPARSVSGCAARLAVVFVLGTIYALVRLAGRIYGHGLLHSGPRLGVDAAWRLTHQR